ncbi:hypothetical protein BT63DRAFT_429899 [Microthyrium microscopicum]|uniref:Bet v1-like protein n=1 Tax=Microthyrium microscopicum TaxID=703497 RepID=A0A6A6TXB4_9PEZI|nr:hypothetical protein BT63DRAFT_429899 [Microthyrium microscopicum]
MSSSPTWPPANGLTTISVPREKAALALLGSAKINAPASLVFDIIRNTQNYKWNSWIPNVTIKAQPDGTPTDSMQLVKDTAFDFHAIMDSSKPNSPFEVHLIVSDISTPESPSDYVPIETLQNDGTFTSDLSTVYRIAWKRRPGSDWMGNMLSCERFHEVIVTGEQECLIRTWENQGAALAYMVKWTMNRKLQGLFQGWCDDLKNESEKQAKGTAA